MRAVRSTSLHTTFDFMRQERRVRVDGVEVAGSLDQLLLLLRQLWQQVPEGFPQGGRVVAIRPRPAEPADAEVEVALAGDRVAGRGRVARLVVVSAVFKRDPVASAERAVVPFGDFGVREQRVVAAEEARCEIPGDVVGRWVVGARRVVGVLPVAVLGLVDGEPLGVGGLGM